MIEIEHLGCRVDLGHVDIIHTASIAKYNISEKSTDPNIALLQALGKLRTALGVMQVHRNNESLVWAE